MEKTSFEAVRLAAEEVMKHAGEVKGVGDLGVAQWRARLEGKVATLDIAKTLLLASYVSDFQAAVTEYGRVSARRDFWMLVVTVAIGVSALAQAAAMTWSVLHPTAPVVNVTNVLPTPPAIVPSGPEVPRPLPATKRDRKVQPPSQG